MFTSKPEKSMIILVLNNSILSSYTTFSSIVYGKDKEMQQKSL